MSEPLSPHRWPHASHPCAPLPVHLMGEYAYHVGRGVMSQSMGLCSPPSAVWCSRWAWMAAKADINDGSRMGGGDGAALSVQATDLVGASP